MRAAWAGVRPLVDGAAGETSELSREDRVAEVEPGVVAVLGGKLTTFRRVAARAADAVAPGASAAYPDLVDVSCADAAGAVDDMAVTLDDAVTRRLCVSACDPAAAEACAPEWADGLAAALGWDDRVRDDELASFRRGLDRFRPPVAS